MQVYRLGGGGGVVIDFILKCFQCTVCQAFQHLLNRLFLRFRFKTKLNAIILNILTNSNHLSGGVRGDCLLNIYTDVTKMLHVLYCGSTFSPVSVI